MNFRYPSLTEVEAYWRKALEEVPTDVSPVEQRPREVGFENANDRHLATTWLKFQGVDGLPFWCLWQPSIHRSARTVIHFPGYGTETSTHPSLAHGGYNVLHVNPRGYCGPDGLGNFDWRNEEGMADVLLRRLDEPERYGYRAWFQDAVIAVRWLQTQGVERLGFYGSSQGGGASLIMGSLLADEGLVGAVAADVPFLTDFRLNYQEGKYGFLFEHFEHLDAPQFETCFYTLGLIDTVIHAPRMRYPVLLVLGQEDDLCPPASIRSLYEKLPHTRALVELHQQGHAYTPPFLNLAKAWFDLYV